MTVTADTLAMRRDERSFLGHPTGLAFIVFTEAWERFSFYGMQALLVLYMSSHLFQPDAASQVIGFGGFRAAVETVFGSLTVQALATQTFGLYIGLIYLMPVLGGLAGDRVLGRRRAVLLGAVLMAVGHFLMAFEPAFFLALASLIVGAGLLKGNLAAQVGALYAKTDSRRDAAFSLYCVAINVGAFVAPLVCGTLGELYGWHYGFGAAGIGMLVGIAIYVAGRHHLPPEDAVRDDGGRARLGPGDGRAIAALLALLAITGFYWVAQTQVWNTYPLWVKGRVDRALFGFDVPVTWFQSLDSLAVLIFAPLVIWFWRRQNQRGSEPGDLVKIALGCLLFTAGCIWLALGEMTSTDGRVALVWPVAFHFITAFAYLYAGPIALAVTSRGAPAAVAAMMVGAYYLALFAGGVVSGWLGRFYETMSPAGFWFLHALIAAAGAALILLFRERLARALRLAPGR